MLRLREPGEPAGEEEVVMNPRISRFASILLLVGAAGCCGEDGDVV